MPTIIALDCSISMLRQVQYNNENMTYHQLAKIGINSFLDYLTVHSKLEFVSLIVYSTLYEVIVDFTRDYEAIRSALNKVEHYDKTNVENLLLSINNIFLSVWGNQNYCQVQVVTDCGIGFGSTSLNAFIERVTAHKSNAAPKPVVAAIPPIDADAAVAADTVWTGFPYPSKLSFICLGNTSDPSFVYATSVYQKLIDVSNQKGEIFTLPLPTNSEGGLEVVVDAQQKCLLNRDTLRELFNAMSETNYKQFEATLKCGSYTKLHCPITIWPPPMPHTTKDPFGSETTKIVSRELEICGYLSLSDIGSPMSVSRHLIFPKIESSLNRQKEAPGDYDKLDAEIKNFYGRVEDEDSEGGSSHKESKDTACVLLHGALKVENMAALTLLNDNWYGFIYSYADSKKKSNLMLNILLPGSDVIPWLGDFRLFGTIGDAYAGENPSFPVKSDKRSYSQSIVVWIKQAGLQSDIQKVLRHAKKLPEKTQNFYKELNRMRRAAVSFGFIELLDGLSSIFEREITMLPVNASPDCTLQLRHAASELRKCSSRDMKTVITALPTKYNQL